MSIYSYYCLLIKCRSRCIDINECERSSPPCSHQCENTPGGYRCICPEGTRLIGGTCESKIDFDNSINSKCMLVMPLNAPSRQTKF